MKFRLLTVLLLTLLRLPAAAGEPWFCVTPGRTLVYERTRSGDGRLERRTEMRFTGVRPDGGGRSVDYLLTVCGPDGRELYGGAAPMSVAIDADGGVLLDLGASIRAVLHNLLPHAEQRIGGTPALLPAELKPGDRLPDAHSVVKTGVLTHTVDITGREVLRFERIRVPAGEFDCVVLRERKVERGIGRNRDTVSENWYARGVGLVRHDSYLYNKGNLKAEASEVLKKY